MHVLVIFFTPRTDQLTVAGASYFRGSLTGELRELDEPHMFSLRLEPKKGSSSAHVFKARAIEDSSTTHIFPG